MTEYNAKETGPCVRRQWEALGYGREQLAELSEISNPFLSDTERGDQGFSVVLLGRLPRVLGFSADYILFGTERVTDVSDTTDIPPGLDGKCTSKLRELLGTYLKTITLAEKQNH